MYKFFIALGMVISSLSVNATAANCFKTSKDLVDDLYKKYPLMDEKKDIAGEKINVLERYFSTNMASLLIQDQKCAAKIQGICNIEFNILSNAQDIPKSNQIKILQATANVVTVKVDFEPSPEFIDFKMQQQAGCYLIKDIQYDDHHSLEKMLRQK